MTAPSMHAPQSQPEYRYALELFRNDGQSLGQVPVTPDWEPALEFASFEAVRNGLMPATTAAARGLVEPVWHESLRPPYVSGFRVVVSTESGTTVAREVPTAYFSTVARSASADFVERGQLTAGELFTYRVCAYAAPSLARAASAGAGDLMVEEIADLLPQRPAALPELLQHAEAAGEIQPGDVPVFVPQRIIDEAIELAKRAGDIETGGILIGHLHHHLAVPEISVEVTALIPAPHTQAESTKVTFTADTWTAVRAAVALRGRGEIQVGWMHSHPDFCRRCPTERRERCTLSSAFFSADDSHLHRVCFGRAFHVALLVSDSQRTGLTWSLFGWRAGMVQQRGCYVLRESVPRAMSIAANAGNGEHENDADSRATE